MKLEQDAETELNQRLSERHYDLLAVNTHAFEGVLSSPDEGFLINWAFERLLKVEAAFYALPDIEHGPAHAAFGAFFQTAVTAWSRSSLDPEVEQELQALSRERDTYAEEVSVLRAKVAELEQALEARYVETTDGLTSDDIASLKQAMLDLKSQLDGVAAHDDQDILDDRGGPPTPEDLGLGPELFRLQDRVARVAHLIHSTRLKETASILEPLESLWATQLAAARKSLSHSDAWLQRMETRGMFFRDHTPGPPNTIEGASYQETRAEFINKSFAERLMSLDNENVQRIAKIGEDYRDSHPLKDGGYFTSKHPFERMLKVQGADAPVHRDRPSETGKPKPEFKNPSKKTPPRSG